MFYSVVEVLVLFYFRPAIEQLITSWFSVHTSLIRVIFGGNLLMLVCSLKTYLDLLTCVVYWLNKNTPLSSGWVCSVCGLCFKDKKLLHRFYNTEVIHFQAVENVYLKFRLSNSKVKQCGPPGLLHCYWSVKMPCVKSALLESHCFKTLTLGEISVWTVNPALVSTRQPLKRALHCHGDTLLFSHMFLIKFAPVNFDQNLLMTVNYWFCSLGQYSGPTDIFYWY